MLLPKIGVDGALLLLALGLLFIVGCRQLTTVSDPPSNQELDVAAVIQTLRQQLLEMDRSLRESGDEPLFNVKEATVTLSFVAKRSDSAEGGVEFQIVTIGASQTVATEAVQTITVKLGPATEVVIQGPSEPPKKTEGSQ